MRNEDGKSDYNNSLKTGQNFFGIYNRITGKIPAHFSLSRGHKFVPETNGKQVTYRKHKMLI